MQYMRASLIVQLIRNLPAMQETWVPFLGWEDPLEKGREGKGSEVAQSCLTLCDPRDCSPPGSSVHVIFQARIME